MQVSGGCQKFTNAIFKTLKLEDWNILVKPPPYYYHPRPSIYIFQAFSYYSINTIYSSINTRTRFWKHYSSLVPYPPTPLYPEAKRGPPKLSKSVQTKLNPHLYHVFQQLVSLNQLKVLVLGYLTQVPLTIFPVISLPFHPFPYKKFLTSSL